MTPLLWFLIGSIALLLIAGTGCFRGIVAHGE